VHTGELSPDGLIAGLLLMQLRSVSFLHLALFMRIVLSEGSLFFNARTEAVAVDMYKMERHFSTCDENLVYTVLYHELSTEVVFTSAKEILYPCNHSLYYEVD
jgi:hypothetical protein